MCIVLFHNIGLLSRCLQNRKQERLPILLQTSRSVVKQSVPYKCPLRVRLSVCGLFTLYTQRVVECQQHFYQYFVLWEPVSVICCVMGGNNSPNIWIWNTASQVTTYSILSEYWLNCKLMFSTL